MEKSDGGGTDEGARVCERESSLTVPSYVREMVQHEAEISALCALFQREGVRSYLEIGSKWGGSLWRVGCALPPGSRLAAVDLPRGTKQWDRSEQSLKQCTRDLREKFGHRVEILWGDSVDPKIVAEIDARGGHDACFIDANHSLSYVTRDWENYGKKCRIAAFHDINWAQRPTIYPVDVPQFWIELRKSRRHEEFRLDPGGRDNGIGVIFND